ncbi:transglutaminase family protein [Paraliomyxa miuraensis]|uniref:transglutaminase family protein n=1 Tax=Paraliomyxa miuraensis TaxID=376150 RepID=UPI002256CF0B|nr:transglutaminase family protein [Paraliomyxa miuraensis]MCX4245356.1 transglutaminase family protein [Paraliomyxa miuraensis]
MRLLIQHRSRYRYPRPAGLDTHTLRLHPAAHAKARIETYRLSCEQAERIRWILDPFGNRVAQVTFPAKTRLSELEVLVEMAVEIRPVNPFDFFVDPRVEALGFSYPVEYRGELAPFLDLREPALATGPRFEALLATLPTTGRTVDALVEANQRVTAGIEYVIRDEPGVWTPEQTLEHGRGSCRDSAMLLVALLRRRGIAARFASGYLVQVADEGMLPDLPRGLDHDVVDLHAWAEAFVPGAGWIGLDATSGLLASEGHIPLATGATPTLAAPLHGMADVQADRVTFEITVARLGHEPRPTAPYTDEVWAALMDAGRRTDVALDERGLVLTMGGEPTFTSRDDGAEPEWNGAALGPSKWRAGLRMAHELRRRLCPGGVVMTRMGKLYPGEPLPRWALDAIGRCDGLALWRSSAVEHEPASERPTAERLARELVDALDLSDGPQPAYEDPWHYVAQEARVPLDRDPLTLTLEDGAQRARLARVLDQGLRAPSAWVIPLARELDTGRWCTQAWSFRREHLFLIPGDSPAGLRLPLDSLEGAPMTWEPVEEAFEPADPRRMDRVADDEDEGVHQRSTAQGRPTASRPAAAVHTALCVEQRLDVDGRPALFVFLPPLRTQADFVELIEVVDRVCGELGLSVMLEGYPPPSGSLLSRVTVTPDPGVLEVNIPPSRTFEDYATLLQTIYDAGLHAGLHTEKYLLDGRLSGSGGGHHLTLGGPTPLRSPFLRRPELLASLITFFQHHPSLSYMFTGLFVGPTSQAPRVDEARHDQLYELEIALEHAHEQVGRDPPPWLPDLLFRNLLVDVTGNAHRAEISIDKLFDPRSPAGRQGLVELRAFEMPPHPRMAVAQMLLARTVVAALAKAPLRAELVRWGQSLHDRFLLPYHLWRDFEDVLAFLDGRGLPLEPDGYRPFVDLRCPLVGHLDTRDVRIELRNAIEPWHVLGEEQIAGGTARYVDSSMERIEIRADGLVPERHAVIVNGRALPLRATDRAGLFVGGVRFRAWAPPHSLHAHLGIHHPLHIDVLDRWAKRSLGACTYHVWHPEGRAFDRPPLTRFEAAARRSQRFTRGDQMAHPIAWDRLERHREGPYTVDLRRTDLDVPMPEPAEE